jgi:hypothetical protein
MVAAQEQLRERVGDEGLTPREREMEHMLPGETDEEYGLRCKRLMNLERAESHLRAWPDRYLGMSVEDVADAIGAELAADMEFALAHMSHGEREVTMPVYHGEEPVGVNWGDAYDAAERKMSILMMARTDSHFAAVARRKWQVKWRPAGRLPSIVFAPRRALAGGRRAGTSTSSSRGSPPDQEGDRPEHPSQPPAGAREVTDSGTIGGAR